MNRKTTLFCRATLLMLSLLFFLPSSFAQAYTRWALPEGANMRLGKGTINEMQYVPDGKLLAVASSIGVWLYDTETYQERTLLTDYTGSADSMCLSTDGHILASGSWDGTIKLWDVATGTLQRTLTSGYFLTGIRLSPDGRTLASAGSSEMGTGIELWDVTTGTVRQMLSPEGYPEVLNMDFSPDGQTLASSSGSDTVRLWDVNTGTLLRTFNDEPAWQYSAHINSMRFSPDGQTLVSASQAETRRGNHKFYTIRLWDVATGEPLKTLTVNTDSDSSLCWSPDGQTLAMGSLDSTIRLWDIASGEPFKMLIAHTDVVFSLCWSADGQMLASASQDGTIQLWDVATGLPQHTFTGHTSRVSSLYWRGDGQTLVAGYDDSRVRLWDAVTSMPRHTFVGRTEDGRSLSSSEDRRAVSLSADGQLLASGNDDTTILLWDVATGALRQTFPGHTKHVSSLCFSADGRLLASGSWGETIRLWDVATGTSLKTLTGYAAASMDFSPNSQTLASGTQLWDVATGTLIHTLPSHDGGISSLSFSPNGQTLASGPWNDSRMINHTIRLWDVNTGELQKTFIAEDFGSVASLCWSPDGQTLASGGGYVSEGCAGVLDAKVRVWNVVTGELQRTFTGHTSEVLSVRFSADGQTLASGSADGTVLLWEMNPQKR